MFRYDSFSPKPFFRALAERIFAGRFAGTLVRSAFYEPDGFWVLAIPVKHTARSGACGLRVLKKPCIV